MVCSFALCNVRVDKGLEIVCDKNNDIFVFLTNVLLT